MIKNGLQWKDAPSHYGPHKTLYNRFVRWSRMGVFDRIFMALAAEGPEPDRIMIDSHASEGPPHRGKPSKKGDVPRRIGRTKGGLNSKLHAVCDEQGKPIILLLSEGQMSDHKGARLIFEALPSASSLIADKGYDSKWFRAALIVRGIEPCIPSQKDRKVSCPMTGSSIAPATRSRTCSPSSRTGDASQPRYDRCAHTFFSAICIAATVAFYLNQ